MSCIFFSLPHLLIALSLSISISVSFVCFYTIFCYMQIFVFCHNLKPKVSRPFDVTVPHYLISCSMYSIALHSVSQSFCLWSVSRALPSLGFVKRFSIDLPIELTFLVPRHNFCFICENLLKCAKRTLELGLGVWILGWFSGLAVAPNEMGKGS